LNGSSPAQPKNDAGCHKKFSNPRKEKANRTLEAVGLFLRPVAAEAAPALKESG
jgi:hypothetical protein